MSYEAQLKLRYADAHRRLIKPDYSPKKVLKVIPKVEPEPLPPPTAPVVSPILSPEPQKPDLQPRYTLDMLARWLCHLERILVSELKSEQRNRGVTSVRQVFYYLAYKHSSNRFTSAQIGRFLNKDHTSVLSGVKKVEECRLTDEQLDHRLKLYEAALVRELPVDSGEYLCALCPYK